ncbi:MAG TPA: universal stress protein [Mycobacteriales bacterium]|nr:universal stress protein [Mycobacteriales bacterium]
MPDSSPTPVVVVGIDGSPSAQAALAWADSYATSTNATLRLVTSWAWPRMYGLLMVVDGLDLEGRAREVLAEAAASATIAPERIETMAVEGAAGEVLLDASKDADLLVVGSEGERGLDRVALGSVSRQCIDHATVPVVVVRRPGSSKPAR